MKTDPSDTTILEEAIRRRSTSSEAREDSRRATAQATGQHLCRKAWPDDDAFGCGY
jgi:hypothetical protein